MAEEVKLNAKIRKDFSGRRMNELRHTGNIPGILYGPDIENLPLFVDDKELRHAISTEQGENALIQLKVGSKKAVTTIIRELQVHPVTMKIIHVDFGQIRMTDTVEVEVPVVVKGEAPGIKTEGGVLEHIIRKISVKCLPADIPDYLKVDISGLHVGDHVKVKDIEIISNIEILDDQELIVMNISAPTEFKETEEAGEPAEPGLVGGAAEAAEESEVAEKSEAKEEEPKE